MVPPRFLLVRGAVLRGSLSRRWPGSYGGDAVIVEPPWFAWRLCGSNHRELGRSAEVFADVPAVVAAVHDLRERLETATVESAGNPVWGTWTWRLYVDGTALASCSRAFRRQRECDDNSHLFLAAVPRAALEFDPSHGAAVADAHPLPQQRPSVPDGAVTGAPVPEVP